MLTVLVSTITNSQAFLLKNVSSFCKFKSYSHFFSKNIRVYAIFNDQSFNDTLINGIARFEQLGLNAFFFFFFFSFAGEGVGGWGGLNVGSVPWTVHHRRFRSTCAYLALSKSYYNFQSPRPLPTSFISTDCSKLVPLMSFIFVDPNNLMDYPFLWLLFYSTLAGVVPCGGRKKSPHTSS